MTHKSKTTPKKRTLLGHSRLRNGVIIVFVLLFIIVGSRIVFSSLAANDTGSYSGGNDSENDTLPSNLPPITPDPPLDQTCSGGVDIAITIDVSGDQQPIMEFRTPVADFASAMLPSPNTQIAITEFDGTDGQVLEPLSANVTALQAAANSLGGAGGYSSDDTDWYTGLQEAYTALAAAPTNRPRLLILAGDSSPSDSDLVNAVNEANIIKADNIHILAIGMDSSRHPYPTQALESISGTALGTGGINVDVEELATYQNLDTALLSLAQSVCGGGSGNGNGGNGTGTNGNGNGSGGNGNGNGGSGTGNSAGTQPSTAPNPAPSPSPSPSPNPAPIASPSPTPNPAPAPNSQGTQLQPPQKIPSPFYDGIQFSPGSAPDNYATTTSHSSISKWWYLAVAALLALSAAGFFLWRKLRPAPASSSATPAPGRPKPPRR